MKKQCVAFILVCFLCLGFFNAQAQTTPFVQILGGSVEGDSLTLTLRLGQAGTVTCLVYTANEKGEQEELLQVTQWDVQREGIHTKELPVSPSLLGYVVQLGGTGIDLPKTIRITDWYVCPALRIEGAETTETLTQNASHLTGVEITRNEHTVTPGDVVFPGDQISGLWGEAPYTGYAVVAGDVDLNGAVNAKDALQILRYAVGKTSLSEASLAAADFKQNGKIDAIAALNILKFAVGKLKSL